MLHCVDYRSLEFLVDHAPFKNEVACGAKTFSSHLAARKMLVQNYDRFEAECYRPLRGACLCAFARKRASPAKTGVFPRGERDGKLINLVLLITLV